MNRERANELLPIIQAFAEGKTIEVKTKEPNDNLWIETNTISENPNLVFRIKPEEKEMFHVHQCNDKYYWNALQKDSLFNGTSAECEEWIKEHEPKRMTYRPFEDTAELMLHYQKHFHVEFPPFYEPLIWVKHKTSDSRYLITSYDELSVNVDDIWLDMKDLFEKYVFLDNSIIGKVVE